MRKSILFLLAMPFAANADLIDIRAEYSFTLDNIVSTPGQNGGGLASNNRLGSTRLTGFDSSLGTLQSVTLGITSSFVLENWLVGDSQDQSVGQMVMSANIHIGSTGEQRIIRADHSVRNYCGTADSGCSEYSILEGAFNDEFATNDILDWFIDRDPLINYASNLITTYTCGDYCFTTAISSWSATLFAEYTYDDGLSAGPVSVPEPGTLALLGIGLFGMGLARRRRQA